MSGDMATDLTGDMATDLTGDMPSDLTGDMATDLTGDMASDLTGDMATDPTGAVTTDPTGAVTTDPTGDMTTDLTGEMTTDLTGDMATDHVNGNGTEEPMDTTAAAAHSEHFQALLEAGLPQQVAEKLDELYVAGKQRFDVSSLHLLQRKSEICFLRCASVFQGFCFDLSSMSYCLLHFLERTRILHLLIVVNKPQRSILPTRHKSKAWFICCDQQ